MSAAVPPPPAGTAALILARGGSKGIPGKNLARVGGLSLLARAVRAASRARGVDGVWVSTDSAAIAAEARAHGARVIDRPAALAGDGASSESGWLHALPAIRAALPGLRRLALLQCTSPFLRPAEIEAAIARLAEGDVACALAVAEDHGFLWAGPAAGPIRGVNHDETQPRRRRQDLPPQWRETGAFYVVDAARFEAVGHRFCGPVAPVPVASALEIDTPADLALAQRLALADDPAQRPDPARLAAVAAVVTDFDGVHTDDRVLVDETGREAVLASRADGLGLARLAAAGGPRLLILSKERNPVVSARAAKLGVEAIQGIDDKAAALAAWLAAAGIPAERALYVGNDVNDLPAMALAGISACPEDARPEVAAAADWVLPHPGGRGALRALAEALLAARGGGGP